jgi:hypothetical protein
MNILYSYQSMHYEYSHLIEFAAEGLDGEIPELQIEIALFAGSSIIYLGLLGGFWLRN